MSAEKEKPNKNSFRCAVFGVTSKYGSDEYNIKLHKAKANVDKLISKGITVFLTSAKQGFELDIAQYILQKKRNNRNIHLVIVRPSDRRSVFWKIAPIYNSVVESADYVKTISETKENNEPDSVTEWILEHCDTVLCITSRDRRLPKRLSKADLSDKTVIYSSNNETPDNKEIKEIKKMKESDTVYPENLLLEIFTNEDESEEVIAIQYIT